MARPRKNLSENGLAIIEQAAANGISERKLAKALGMSLDTWLEIRRETHTEPSRSVDRPVSRRLFNGVRAAIPPVVVASIETARAAPRPGGFSMSNLPRGSRPGRELASTSKKGYFPVL